VLAVVQQDGTALEFASEALRGRREVVLTAVRQSGLALQFSQLREEREVVLVAVRQNWRAIEFASMWLRRDPEVMAELCLECERLEGEWRQPAAELHAAGSERDAELRRAAEAAADQPPWLVLSRFLRAAVADRRAAWDESWLECPWLPAAWEACERFDGEEDDRHAALRHAAAAVVDQPHARPSVALRRVSAGSMVFLSVPD
jgi:hypothetical protein